MSVFISAFFLKFPVTVTFIKISVKYFFNHTGTGFLNKHLADSRFSLGY